ncbi:Rubrerythrin [Anaerobranca californiensis DSM 14826]|jgi:rubrerythrin|uniref:Rubrerythrin n=1 Tax=Anaerobranca californiensis DSM 14826 TaxID=1120989 RepID=A0A1M6S2H3_9FIRM|nr:ferritin family protein [Anaerobranca californiensis]SHK38933.1 Rubrerythrin [Anaerobranca californiensis DSM 14826]
METRSYKEIFAMAVENEVEAYEFYKDAAGKVKDENLKYIFDFLAKEELNHKALLQGFIKDESKELVFEDFPVYDVVQQKEEKKLSTEMKFVDAIALAISKEEEAMELYQGFADRSKDPEQAKIFTELVKMEKSHKAKLEEIYVNASAVEAW